MENNITQKLMENKETLEEVAEKWVFETNGHKWSNNDDTAGDNFASFIAGAKWQQEQDKNNYSELIDLLERLSPIYREDSDLYQKYEEKRVEIIEQFKSK